MKTDCVHKSSTSKRYANAFTLIELLVVIAIISILASILFPVFATAREKARQTTCASNERQLGMAFLQYTSDFDEMFPCSEEQPGSGYFGYGWAGKLNIYVRSAAAFQCPDDITTPKMVTVAGINYELTPVSYAYNASIPDANPQNNNTYGFGIAASQAKLHSPSKTVLLVEISSSKNYSDLADLSTPNELGSNGRQYSAGLINSYAYNDSGSFYVPLATGYMGGPGRSSTFSFPNYLSPIGRHTAGSNYLLADGHVKWLRGDDVSTGLTLTGNYRFPQCDAIEDGDQDRNGCHGITAGTQSSQPWQATWSPI